ncbi:MAG TPA: Flp family type IVb pilin [Candidatus Gastranaerophilaceae bacterium]|nr:Flp family type IVb pilin [Candidatus Gastranaerophilaceae bacterium]HPT41383.1 Flp family type IVb pilin [Candidatus Gastranaerophilaceae bacterium]
MKKTAQSLIEYGLILALVAIVALAVLSKFGGTIGNVGNSTDTQVQKVTENSGAAYCNSVSGQWNEDTKFCDITP